MSQSYFCPSCGGKNLYDLHKPKFCSICGTAFGVSTFKSVASIASTAGFSVSIGGVAPPPASQPATPRVQRDSRAINNDNYENDDYGDYSNLNSLNVIIEKSNTQRGLTLENLAFGGDPEDHQRAASLSANSPKLPRKRGRKKIIKEMPQSFVSEASMIGRHSRNDSPDFGDGE